jgi:hypothetical protein
MTPAHPTQAHLDSLLADAKLGRALREAAEALAPQLVEELRDRGVEIHTDAGETIGAFVADSMHWEERLVTESDAGTLLRDLIERAADECDDCHRCEGHRVDANSPRHRRKGDPVPEEPQLPIPDLILDALRAPCPSRRARRSSQRRRRCGERWEAA